jgi:hypothetical protein
MRYREKLNERGDGVALDSMGLHPRRCSLLSRIAYRIFIDTHLDCWGAKLMPRMRCRTRYWQLTST